MRARFWSWAPFLPLAGIEAACGDWEAAPPEEVGTATGGAACAAQEQPPVDDYPRGLRVVGNRIQDANGNDIVLRGVNRSGSEYQCTKNQGIFDGPADEASVRAIASWGMNAVRVPLNETCWLGLHGLPERVSGEAYKNAILDYVALLHRYALVPILDLHWAAPGDVIPQDLWPMPNADHTERFWAEVAATFADDDGVVLEPYNEPFPDRNADSDAAWQCWRDGCTTTTWSDESYEAVGMQALVDAIRGAGSEHVLLLGGVQYSNSLSQWLAYMPTDPLNNLGAAWHIYNFNGCSSESCWEGVPSDVMAEVPVVTTEIGQNDCQGDFITPLMQWLDERRVGYLAWSWNVIGACAPDPAGMELGNPWPLVTDYECPQPNGAYARAYYDHLIASR